jgi:hypothetical protein
MMSQCNDLLLALSDIFLGLGGAFVAPAQALRRFSRQLIHG